jgi:hypothetical protein
LILDEDFTSLQNLSSEEVNLMDILKVSKKELQHSNFLAWFFDPKGSHNINDFALKEFIKIYFKQNEGRNLGNATGLSVFDFVHLDFDDLEIRREEKNIDLILLSRKNEFCIVIENKIHAGEGKGQLEKYKTYIEYKYPNYKHKIYIFLSLEDQEISDSGKKHYVQLNYDHIIKLLEQVLTSRRLKLAEKTKFVFEQYLQTLKSMLNKNEEIEKIAQNLYKKYRSAFDLVLKYAGSREIGDIIEGLIKNEKNIELNKSTKSCVSFIPNELSINIDSLKKYGLFSEADKLNELFLFEFNLRNDQVIFQFSIGPGEQTSREKIYGAFKNNGKAFNNSTKKELSNKWHQVFKKEILSKIEVRQYLDDEKSEIGQHVESRFRELIEKYLPNLIGCINQEINGDSEDLV